MSMKCYFLVNQLCFPSHNVLLPPAGVFYISAEEAFLSAVINYTNSSTVHFKLSPAYILYAAGRYTLQRHYRRASPPPGHTHGATSIANKMVAMTGKVIQASARRLLLFVFVFSESARCSCEFFNMTPLLCFVAEAAGHRRRSRLLDGQLLRAAELPQA